VSFLMIVIDYNRIVKRIHLVRPRPSITMNQSTVGLLMLVVAGLMNARFTLSGVAILIIAVFVLAATSRNLS
jgi:hypothetical protein